MIQFQLLPGGANVLLRQDSPIYDLFPSGLLPVTNWIPVLMEFGADPEAMGFYVDLNRCTDLQKESLIELIANQCDYRPDEIRRDIFDGHRVPIRASNCHTEIS